MGRKCIRCGKSFEFIDEQGIIEHYEGHLWEINIVDGIVKEEDSNIYSKRWG